MEILRDKNLKLVEKWKNDKIKDICYCISTFFNYLIIPRTGFLQVQSRTRDTFKQSVSPRLSREIVDYVIKEIFFPCAVMENKEGIRMDKNIREEIKNQLEAGSGKDIIIDDRVYDIIWNFIRGGVDTLLQQEDVEQYLDILNVEIIARRNYTVAYGFNDPFENSAFEAILYIFITLSDWLEMTSIDNKDVLTCYRIIFPPDLQEHIEPVDNIILNTIIRDALVSKDFIPLQSSVQLLTGIMIKIKYLFDNPDKNATRVINRLMSFANPS